MNKNSPINFNTIADVYAYLSNIPSFQTSGMQAANMGLENVTKLCKAIGNPQNRFRSIHIAGTNGKGSVSAMLTSVFEQAGYKVGMYTSPHLVDVRERIRCNGSMISEQDFLRFFQSNAEVIAQYPHSYFELLTVVAFWYFAEQEVDIAVIETGLGGRFDATNIIHPEISAITTVSRDHTDYLGDSIREIAFEKAGIIKKQIPVVTGNLPPDAAGVIEKVAADFQSEVIVSENFLPEVVPGGFRLVAEKNEYYHFNMASAAVIQKHNIAVSLGILYRLKEILPVQKKHIEQGISGFQALLRGRMEKLHPDYDWYFDGAHNLQAVQALMQTLENRFPNREPVLFFSIMKDKIDETLLNEFCVLKSVYYHKTDNPRVAAFESVNPLLKHCRNNSDDESRQLTLLESLKSELVIFTGSFYFYSTVRKWMEKLF